jgi:hypothetical protein
VVSSLLFRGAARFVPNRQTADDGSGGADSSRALHVGQLSEFGDGSGIEVALSVAGVQESQRDQTDTSGMSSSNFLRRKSGAHGGLRSNASGLPRRQIP